MLRQLLSRGTAGLGRLVAAPLAALPLLAALSVSPASAGPATGGPVEVSAELDRAILKAGQTQTVYLKISLAGLKAASSKSRAPMNVALVIDRSGSMAGPRIEGARRAALMAVDRLGRDDILSVVSYDDRIEVEVPATKVTNTAAIRDKISRLTPRGSTAIHAGLLAGAEEIRKFKSKEKINRIILLSDGLANVGPSKPADFVGLGRELASEGITVSTIGLGLGYNEDLMSGLAKAADGSHVFVQEPADLTAFLAREFDDALGIVAQEIEVIIQCKAGVKPIRSLGRDARINGNRMTFKVATIVGGADHVLLAELEVPAEMATGAKELVGIEVGYQVAGSGEKRSASSKVSAAFDPSVEASDKSIRAEVMKDVVTLVSRAERQEAVRLRDEGKSEEAKKKFETNAAFLRQQQKLLPGAAAYAPLTSELKASEAAAAPAAQSAEGWAKVRKGQREVDGNASGAATKY